MINNVGTVDKVIRILLALVIAALGWYYQTWWGLVALLGSVLLTSHLKSIRLRKKNDFLGKKGKSSLAAAFFISTLT